LNAIRSIRNEMSLSFGDPPGRGDEGRESGAWTIDDQKLTECSVAFGGE
jgi:hypothetical protein